MARKKPTIREICHISVFKAAIAVCAQVSIAMPYGVPLTLQTFAIALAGVVLGKKNGVYATLVYVLLGAVGAPVFTGLTGGLGVVFGIAGGFVLSFPLLALAAGIGGGKNKAWLFFWLLIGTAVNFFCGMLMFCFVTSGSLMLAFTSVVLPFLPTESLKILMVVATGKWLKQRLAKSGIYISSPST